MGHTSRGKRQHITNTPLDATKKILQSIQSISKTPQRRESSRHRFDALSHARAIISTESTWHGTCHTWAPSCHRAHVRLARSHLEDAPQHRLLGQCPGVEKHEAPVGFGRQMPAIPTQLPGSLVCNSPRKLPVISQTCSHHQKIMKRILGTKLEELLPEVSTLSEGFR